MTEKLIITADVHGSYAAWLTLCALLSPNDHLAVAGDLFDTRYGNYSHPDFQPDEIRKVVTRFSHPFYYVYGNCDVERFLPGYNEALDMALFGKTIYIHHGHRPLPPEIKRDLVIQGHTHLCELDQREGQLFLNPGSITRPKNGVPTYAVLDEKGVSLIALKTGDVLKNIVF